MVAPAVASAREVLAVVQPALAVIRCPFVAAVRHRATLALIPRVAVRVVAAVVLHRHLRRARRQLQTDHLCRGRDGIRRDTETVLIDSNDLFVHRNIKVLLAHPAGVAAEQQWCFHGSVQREHCPGLSDAELPFNAGADHHRIEIILCVWARVRLPATTSNLSETSL